MWKPLAVRIEGWRGSETGHPLMRASKGWEMVFSSAVIQVRTCCGADDTSVGGRELLEQSRPRAGLRVADPPV